MDLSRHNLGKFLGELGEYTEAEQLYLGMLPRLRQRDGAQHPRTTAAETALARIHLDTDRPARALPLWDSALASALKHRGEQDTATAIVRLGGGRSLHALGRAQQALTDFEFAIATYTSLGENGRGGLGSAFSERARVRLSMQDVPAALADARAGLAALPESARAGRGHAQAVLAECLAADGDAEGARQALSIALGLLAGTQPANAPEPRQARALAARLGLSAEP